MSIIKFGKTGKIMMIICAVLILTLSFSSMAFAKSSLTNAQMISVVDGDLVKVDIEYKVNVLAGTEEIPLQALTMLGTSLVDIEAAADGAALDINLEEQPNKISGAVTLPAPPENDEELIFTITYVVENGIKIKGEETEVVVPLITVMWPPLNALPGVFVSELTVTEGSNYIEGFPSLPVSINYDGPTKVTHDLQVLPAMVKYVGTSGKVPFFNFDRTVDLIIVVILLIGAVFSYMAIKKTGTAPRSKGVN